MKSVAGISFGSTARRITRAKSCECVFYFKSDSNLSSLQIVPIKCHNAFILVASMLFSEPKSHIQLFDDENCCAKKRIICYLSGKH